MATKIVKHLKSLLPIPDKWTREGKSFALKIEEAYKEIQIRLDDIWYSKGSLSFPFNAFGMVGETSTTMYTNISMDKLLPDGTYTVKSFSVLFRGIDGYADGRSHHTEYVGLSNYTVAASRKNGGRLLVVRVQKTTEIEDAPINTPLIVSGTIDFTIT